MQRTTASERRRHPAAADPLLEATFLGEVLEQATVAAFVLDDDLNYVAVNQAACELTGYSRRELLELHEATLVLDPRDRAARRRDALAAGTAILRSKSGSVVEVVWRRFETGSAGKPFTLGLCWPADSSVPLH